MTGSSGLRWRLALTLVLVVHLAVLYAPDAGGAPVLPGLDKVVHVATFASVAFVGLGAGLAARWWVPVVAGHAVVSELVQHWLLPHRSGDPADVLADLVGVGLGVLAARLAEHASWGGDRAGSDPHGAPAGRHPGAG